MPRRSPEIWYALGAIAAITAVYAAVTAYLGSVPGASDLFGHGLGIVGFVLMLMTESLYSLRKRSRRARWGRMSSWLRFHIFTGLFGPYLVLLHTSWKFNGLAGIVTALMIVVVISGIVGRYIYTAVPRSADGIELQAVDLERQVATVEANLQRWLAAQSAETRALGQRMAALPQRLSSSPTMILGRTFQEWAFRWRWRRELGQQSELTRAQARELDRLLRSQRTLDRQKASLALARRMLATWHTVHIPIGMALFSAAIIHIAAAIYYATLLR